MQGSMDASTSLRPLGADGKAKGKQRQRQSKSIIVESGFARSEATYKPPALDLKKYVHGRAVNPNVRNKKLATHLSSLATQQNSSAVAAHEHDNLLLSQDLSSRLQVETDLERTWKVSQGEIAQNIGLNAAQKAFTLRLEEFGPYEIDYTTDGRHLAIAGRKGHIGTFDWHAGKLSTELHLKETVRDISWLHNTSFFAVAQKKYVYIYDHAGLEVHQLRNHIEVNRMQFLRYHFLLATVGNTGFLKYQDTSTGTIVAEQRTKLGACSTMAQNSYSGVISLGHSNGTVTMWTPNLATAQVTLLAHNGPITAISYDPSSTGQYFATTGLDGILKVWDIRKWSAVNEWRLRKPASSVCHSQRGLLAVGWGQHVTVYSDSSKSRPPAPGPYMAHSFPSNSLTSLAFCPFEDILGVGHAYGFNSLLIPGAGEANYDSLEADPFESKKSRREREVLGLLDKIQPDQIQLEVDLIGKLVSREAPKNALYGMGTEAQRLAAASGERKKSYSQLSRVERLKVNEQEEGSGSDEEGENALESPRPRKARGKSKVLKRILRRKKNIIDARSARVKELIEERRLHAIEARKRNVLNEQEAAGALDRFG